MAKCKNCFNDDLLFEFGNDGTKKWFHFCHFVCDNLDPDEERDCEHYVTATNAEKIRKLTDEELGKAMFNFMLKLASNPDCVMGPSGYTKWLQSPVEV